MGGAQQRLERGRAQERRFAASCRPVVKRIRRPGEQRCCFVGAPRLSRHRFGGLGQSLVRGLVPRRLLRRAGVASWPTGGGPLSEGADGRMWGTFPACGAAARRDWSQGGWVLEAFRPEAPFRRTWGTVRVHVSAG